VYRAGYCVIHEPPMLHRALSEPSLAPPAPWTIIVNPRRLYEPTPPMVADNSHSNIQTVGKCEESSSHSLVPHSWLNQHKSTTTRRNFSSGPLEKPNTLLSATSTIPTNTIITLVHQLGCNTIVQTNLVGVHHEQQHICCDAT